MEQNNQPTSKSSSAGNDLDDYSLGLVLMQHIEGQLERADTKAQFTMTINALLLATSSIWNIRINQIVDIKTAPFVDVLILFLSVLILLVLVVATVLAMVAVMPTLTLPEKAQNIFYFGTIIKTTERTFLQYVKNYSRQGITAMLYSEIYALAAIAEKKYLLIKRSYFLLLGAVVLWGLLQFLVILFPL